MSVENQAGFLETQSEKPTHYQYLKEFRVEQCPNFIQHKCTSHKPYTCFRWHFQNQRRRRPVRRRDGTFNYSPDVYCTKYDETTGICEDGDECPYLHRTSGDTERRYHLRYYKTGICVYDTDSRGFCVKNGQHCAFAHGIHDLRSPVYDIRELQAMETGANCSGGDGNGVPGGNGTESLNGPNNLDKERNALNEDPRWNESAYVLANYKTELCKRPPRLCRQGYACPQYHNAKDKRRSPKKAKYRSTPCPNVKAGDEWGDPANCEAGDNCAYCHTRTEQQFHPEIYKSTKCNDVLQTAYCPRGPFCAFAHSDKEMQSRHELMNEDVELKNFSLILNGNNNNNNLNGGNNNNGGNSGLNSSSNATSISNNAGRSHSKSVSIASSLPDHYSMPGVNNLLNSNKNNLIENNSFSPQTSTSSQAGGNISVAERSIGGFSLGAIGTRPRSYSTSQASNNAAVSSNFDFFDHIGRGSLNNQSDLNNLMNGDLRSSSTNRRSSGMFDSSPSPLYTRAFGANATPDIAAAASRARTAIAENYNTADTVESVVESAIGEIDLSLDDIDGPFDIMSRGTMSSNLVNGITADTLIEHHHPSQQNSTTGSSFLTTASESGLSMPGSAPVNIPGSRLNSERSLNLNTSPPITVSPLTSSLGHSLGLLGCSPFRHQISSTSSQQNSSHNASSNSSLPDPCQLFKKMFFPRFNLFLTLSRLLYYPESLSVVGSNMILEETYQKFEFQWKELLRESTWGQKEMANWMNSNFPVMKDFALNVFNRYSREIMVQDRAGSDVVDDEFMDQLLNSRSSRTGSSPHLM